MLIDSLNSLTKEFTIEFPNHKVDSDWTASYELEAHSGVMLKITGTPFECAKSITQTQYSIDFEGKQFYPCLVLPLEITKMYPILVKHFVKLVVRME